MVPGRVARMPRVTLNGERKDVEAGVTILDALGREGIHVPHLCHDPRVAPVGACRLCVVEIEGRLARLCIEGPVLSGHVRGQTPAVSSGAEAA